MQYEVFKTKISTHFCSPSYGHTASLGKCSITFSPTSCPVMRATARKIKNAIIYFFINHININAL